INNCPMEPIKPVIQRSVEAAGKDAALQMQIIRRIIEDVYGGTWGVLIIKNPDLVSTAVHWTIPDHKHRDGSPAFCLHVEKNWQYNVFKTGDVDTENRVTVEQMVEKLREGKDKSEVPSEIDRRIAAAFRRRRNHGTLSDDSPALRKRFLP
ncbi:Protein C54D10.9, partial [Aphelenchoides avenae]